MNVIRKSLAMAVVAATFSSGVLFAQDHHEDHRDDHHDNRRDNREQHQNHPYVHHEDWHRGARMNQNDWNRGDRIDYRTYHLRAPRRGYEWREVDGNYVLAAIATGTILSAIAASSAR